jgi:RNA polymerase sigma factor (sigma-70 family)
MSNSTLTKKQASLIGSVLTDAYNTYEQGLLKRALFKTSDSALGEDLVQITFLKTWVYLLHGGQIDLMRAFLYHVLNGLIIDEYRKRKTVSLDACLEHGFDIGHNESERLCNFIDGKAAMVLMGQLPKKYERIMSLRYTQGLTLDEVSHITDQVRNTVAVQSHRGLTKLKELYASQ